MKLSQWCLVLGLAYALPNFYGWAKPRGMMEWLRRFPRNVGLGVVLILAATVWFEWNLAKEDVSDFAAYKPALQLLFAATGVGCCVYLRDYLSVRGLSVLLLLLAHQVLEVQRWHDQLVWKNVATVWAYAWVVMGMWWLVSPWRARDWIAWNVSSEGRFRRMSLVRGFLGTFVAGVGLTVL